MMDNPDMMRFALIGAKVEKKLFRGKAMKVESILRDDTINQICKVQKVDLSTLHGVIEALQSREFAATDFLAQYDTDKKSRNMA